MKKSLFIAGILALTLAYACRKDFGFNDQNTESITSPSLEAAKVFHAQGATLNTKSYKALFNTSEPTISGVKKTTPRPFTKLAPQWKKSFTLQASDNETLIVVPTIERKLEEGPIEIRRFFIFTERGNKIIDGKIVEVVAENYPLKNKIETILKNYKNSDVAGFNGAVFEYDLNYFAKAGIGFENGKKTRRPATIKAVPLSVKTVKKISVSDFETNEQNADGCTKVYFCFGIDGGVRCHFMRYIESYCSNPPPPQGSDSGTDSSGSQTGSGDYSGNTNPPSYTDIISYVTDPCLKNSVNKALAADITFNVNYSLCSIFGNNDDVNLNIYQEQMPFNLDGYTTATGGSQVNSNASTVNVDITLNTLRTSSSQEFVVSTVIHEALHGYFRYRNSIDGLDHVLMAELYIDWYKFTMEKIYPNIDPDVNNALAWGGLEQTAAWWTKSQTERTHILSVNAVHRDGSSGIDQICN